MAQSTAIRIGAAQLPYLVQLADNHEFDFGGEEGGIAAFRNKGDAYAYAQTLCQRLNRSTRVVNMARRGQVEFLLNPFSPTKGY